MDIKAIVAETVEAAFRKFGFVPASERTQEEQQQDPPAPHPVLTAALAAEIDTPEKFAVVVGEAKTGREALATKREEAKAAAIAFFGQDRQSAIDDAHATVDATSSMVSLAAMTDTWLAGAPGADHAGRRLTQRPPTTGSDQQRPENGGGEENAGSRRDGLDPNKIYAGRNRRGRTPAASSS